ncbi:MAG TPA: hypothetical protein VM598_12215, partial [Bdellovibrionota bacterium]|nr:hypothetical protein [Bdellovibrionota bacterium]
MKTSLIALTLSLLISSVCHAQRGESGTRGGGGPVPLRKATLRALLEGANPPVKVKLKNLAEHAEEAFVPERFRKDYQDLVNREVNDSSGRVYKGLVGDLRSPYKIVDSSLVVPPADAPELCEANGVQVPASSGINRPGEEICFDVNLLEAQGTTLHELVGIAGHEHGWHLGILDHGHRLEQTVAALSARFDEQAIERVSTVPGIQPILSGICEYGISIGKSPKDSIEPEFDRGYIIIGKESGWLN